MLFIGIELKGGPRCHYSTVNTNPSPPPLVLHCFRFFVLCCAVLCAGDFTSGCTIEAKVTGVVNASSNFLKRLCRNKTCTRYWTSSISVVARNRTMQISHLTSPVCAVLCTVCTGRVVSGEVSLILVFNHIIDVVFLCFFKGELIGWRLGEDRRPKLWYMHSGHIPCGARGALFWIWPTATRGEMFSLLGLVEYMIHIHHTLPLFLFVFKFRKGSNQSQRTGIRRRSALAMDDNLGTVINAN